MKKIVVDCMEVLDHICENLDDRLSSRRCREIRRHMQHCPNCRAYLDSVKKTILLYRRYPVPAPKKDLYKKLHAAISPDRKANCGTDRV